MNTIHYNVVVSACRKESFWPLSLDLVTGVAGMRSLTLEPSIVSFNSVAAGSWLLSLQLLRQSRQRMLRATAVSYNSACNAISEVQTDKFASGSKQWPWALQVFSEMSQESISSDQVGLTAAMKAVGLNSSPSDPHSWQIVLTAIEADGHCDVVSFTTAITICGAAKLWQVALSLLQHMSGISNLVPNRISFGAAISACEKASQWTWALQLLDRIQNAESFQPNEIILSAVISACEKSSRWEIALSLLLSLGTLDLEMTSESYNPVIAASSTSNWQLACELFTQIPAMRLSPDSFSYAAMMKAFAQGSKWQAALLFLQESSSDWKNGNDGKPKSPAVICESQEFSREMLWNSAMNACLRGTQWQIALDIFNTMFESETFNETSFNAAISACAQGSNWQVAMNLLHLLYIRGVVPSVVSYSAAITSCGEWGRALELMEEMRRNEVLPNVVTYNSIINVCEKGLQWQLALQIFPEVEKNEKISVDLILYSSVISACGTASAWLIALHLFHESQALDEMMDAEAMEVATVAAITACERGCQWQFALQLLHTMLRMKLDDSMSSLACERHVRQMSCHYI